MSKDQKYWKENIDLIVKCLSIWFISSYVFSIILVEQLNAIKIERPLTNKEQVEYDKELVNTARTSSSMLGYNSEAMETGSIGKFLGEINNIYNEVSTQRAPEQIRREGQILSEKPTEKESIEKGWPEESDSKITEVFTTGWEGVKEAKGKAELEDNIDGSKSIKKLIIE